MLSNISLYAVMRRILNELNEQVVDHGERVAYLYLKMAQYRALPDDRQLEERMLACFAHDIGAYKTEKFLDLLRFDVTNTLEHCIYGYLFMKYFSPLQEAAEVLLYHHTLYADRALYDSPYLADGMLIHFLDRVDILHIKYEDTRDILRLLHEGAGRNFAPRDAEDFEKAEERYHLIAHLRDGSYREEVRRYFDRPEHERLLRPIIFMLAYEVDFRSEQTVVHTITVTLLAWQLGRELGLSREEQDALTLAAAMHDLGKISVPTEILEKPARLTPEEYEIMKTHVVHSERIIRDLFPEEIVRIAVRHHERSDGSGYPHGLAAAELTRSERIMQVADVASALMQRRSYKQAMERDEVLSILQKEADAGRLDGAIVAILAERYDYIVSHVRAHAAETIRLYEGLQDEYQRYLVRYAGDGHTPLDGFELIAAVE